MTDETHVDGSALGAGLNDIFGREVTHQRGCCDACGQAAPLATLNVYRTAGDVMRCSNCGAVAIVIVERPAGTRVTFGSLRWLEISPE